MPKTDVPLFHMHELTGMMTEIVKKYLQGIVLDQPELYVLRWYVYQWVKAMPSKPPDFERILYMSQEQLKAYCWDVLMKEYSIDPF